MRRLLLTPPVRVVAEQADLRRLRRFRLRSLPVWVVAIGLGLMLLAAPAQAHGDLVEGSPGPGDDVAAGSTLLQLEFEALDTDSRALVAIVDESGDPIAVGEADFADDRHVCASTDALDPGVYTLDYRVGAEDDHPLTGRYQFEVSEGGSAVQAQSCGSLDLSAPGEARTIADMSGGGVPLWAIVLLFLVALAMGVVVVIRIARDRSEG